MKKIFYIVISAAMSALMFVGCKPTENNYKAAYDAAQAKREAANAELMRPTTGMLSDDGPMMRILEGDTVYVSQERLRNPDGSKMAGKWGVAVALYKMSTNAKATVSDLQEKGYLRACEALGGREKHYALITAVSTLDSARQASVDFRKEMPGYPYVGLPGSPVIIRY